MITKILAGKSHRSQIAGFVSSKFEMNTLPRMAARLNIEEILEGNSMFKKTGILIAALVLAFPVFAEAKTLYVNNSASPACSDSTTYAANDSSHPWCTIGRAAWGSTNRATPNASQAAAAADTVYVTAGTYTAAATNDRWGVTYGPANSGTLGNPITFEAVGPVNLQHSSGVGPSIGATGKNYITWRGFSIDEATARGAVDTGPVVIAGGAIGITIDRCNIDGDGNPNNVATNHPGIRLESCSDVTITNNYIHDFTNTSGGGLGDANATAVQAYDSGRVTIANNRIERVGCGIELKDLIHWGSGYINWFSIHHNWIEDVTAGVYHLRAPFTTGSPGKFYHNVVKTNSAMYGMGILTGGDEGTNLSIVNNTFIAQPTNSTFVFYRDQGTYSISSGNKIWNNIFYGFNGSSAFVRSYGTNSITNPANWDFEHNLYYPVRNFYENSTYTFATWKSTVGQDNSTPSSIANDPLFVNAAANNYTLQSNSPARTLGVDVLDLDSDGSTTDIIPAGAYVTGNEVIGPTFRARLVN